MGVSNFSGYICGIVIMVKPVCVCKRERDGVAYGVYMRSM